MPALQSRGCLAPPDNREGVGKPDPQSPSTSTGWKSESGWATPPNWTNCCRRARHLYPILTATGAAAAWRAGTGRESGPVGGSTDSATSFWSESARSWKQNRLGRHETRNVYQLGIIRSGRRSHAGERGSTVAGANKLTMTLGRKPSQDAQRHNGSCHRSDHDASTLSSRSSSTTQLRTTSWAVAAIRRSAVPACLEPRDRRGTGTRAAVAGGGYRSSGAIGGTSLPGLEESTRDGPRSVPVPTQGTTRAALRGDRQDDYEVQQTIAEARELRRPSKSSSLRRTTLVRATTPRRRLALTRS
jgi:hypothetical protein